MNAAAKVLDPCSASRMMWFDKQDQRALFGDIRDEEHLLCDGRALKVEPDVLTDLASNPNPYNSQPAGERRIAKECSPCTRPRHPWAGKESCSRPNS